MYILYMDESGVEELNAGSSHFVLLGLMIAAEEWKPIDQAMEAAKARYDLSAVEIHTAWMARRYREQESVPGFVSLDRPSRRVAAEAEVRKRAGILGVSGTREKIKAYRRESKAVGPYLHLSADERRSCLTELARQLVGFRDVRIFAEAISKADFGAAIGTPYEMAFEQVLTRFQAFLGLKRGIGIVVHDNNSKAAARLTTLSRKFHVQGTLYRRITNIVETPLFVDSSLTSMIQIADLCAYALRRQIENRETDLWGIVGERVDRKDGVSVGVRHYTGRRSCRCAICVAHGRQ